MREMEKRWRVGLYVSEALDSVEIEVNDDKVECLWVRIRGKVNKDSILVENL